MFCPNCGNEIKLASPKFCHHCGFDLSEVNKLQHPESGKSTEIPFERNSDENGTSNVESQVLHSPPIQPPDSSPVGDASKSTPEVIPHIRQASSEQESWWSRFNGRWGWGWAILGWLYINPTATKTLNKLMDEDSVRILQLAGLIVSLSVYFLFRQKILARVQTRWLRSLTSGVIAFSLTFLSNTILSEFLPLQGSNTSSSQVTSLDHNVSNVLDAEMSQLTLYLTNFAKKDKSLWQAFISEPESNQQFRANISVLDQLIPLYKQKDSVMISTYQRIVDAFDSSPSWKAKAPQLVSDVRSIVTKGKVLAVANQAMLTDLRRYYVSLVQSDGHHNESWKSYEASEARVQQLSQELSPILLRITGKNLDQTKQDLLNKYYK